MTSTMKELAKSLKTTKGLSTASSYSQLGNAYIQLDSMIYALNMHNAKHLLNFVHNTATTNPKNQDNQILCEKIIDLENSIERLNSIIDEVHEKIATMDTEILYLSDITDK